jgi:serine protease Do
VTRGWLGVGIQDLTPKLREYYDLEEGEGVLVIQVYKGDPADKGGMKSGDVIIAVDGKKVSSTRELSRAVANAPVGKRTTITVMRNGKDKKIAVILAKRQDSDLRAEAETEGVDPLGLELTELAPGMAWKYGFSREEGGVLVIHVRPGSKGAQAGILRGDLIKEINHTPVATLRDYVKALEKAESGSRVRLLIKRPHAGLLAMNIPK